MQLLKLTASQALVVRHAMDVSTLTPDTSWGALGEPLTNATTTGWKDSPEPTAYQMVTAGDVIAMRLITPGTT